MGCVLLSSGCSSMTAMKDFTYQVSEEEVHWSCTSKWVGVMNSFPTGRRDMCEEVE